MKAMTIQNLHLRADVRALGAELTRFGTVGGLEFLWDGNPAVWPRTSPVLFPVVGRCREDRIRTGGRDYPMARHGFVRDRRFDLLLASRESCTYRLRWDEETTSAYPFPFELRVTHTLEDWTLRVTTEVVNPGEAPLPFFLGAHPAFRWPICPHAAREAHRLQFEHLEAAPVRRLSPEGLLQLEPQSSPVVGTTLALHDGLFEGDALIFDQLTSRAVRLEAPGCPVLQIDWAGYRELGLWSKPGAGFLCIEPWLGMASRVDEACALEERPGVGVLAPGQERAFHWSVTVLGQ